MDKSAEEYEDRECLRGVWREVFCVGRSRDIFKGGVGSFACQVRALFSESSW